MLDFDDPQIRDNIKNRILYLKEKIKSKQNTLYCEIKAHTQQIVANKKYRQDKPILDERIMMSQTFMKSVGDIFFNMIENDDFLSITPEQVIDRKIEEFGKEIRDSLKKITQNLSEKPKKNEQDIKSDISCEDEIGKPKSGQKKPIRGKNNSLPDEARLNMTDFLVKNFNNPYPDQQQQKMMGREGNIKTDQVRQWFVNRRQRTIKFYLAQKDRRESLY